MERPKMNRKVHRSGPVERSDSQFKNPENPSNRTFLYPCIQEVASSSRTYEKHHFPGLYTSDIYMRPGHDQDSNVVNRFCSKWRPPARIQARVYASVRGIPLYAWC